MCEVMDEPLCERRLTGLFFAGDEDDVTIFGMNVQILSTDELIGTLVMQADATEVWVLVDLVVGKGSNGGVSYFDAEVGQEIAVMIGESEAPIPPCAVEFHIGGARVGVGGSVRTVGVVPVKERETLPPGNSIDGEEIESGWLLFGTVEGGAVEILCAMAR